MHVGSVREPTRGWWEPGDAPPAASALPGALSACTPPAHSKQMGGAQEGTVSSSPNRGGKLCFLVASFPDAGTRCLRSSGQRGFAPCAFFTGVFLYFLRLGLFFLPCVGGKKDVSPPTPSSLAIKSPSTSQWWQEMTSVTLPLVCYELMCIPFPDKASCPFLNLGYN